MPVKCIRYTFTVEPCSNKSQHLALTGTEAKKKKTLTSVLLVATYRNANNQQTLKLLPL
jgi:hypothetical protein